MRVWVGVCFARNKVSVSGKVNDHNCSCVTYFLQLILIQIARRVKVESGESDHKSLTVFIYKYFSLRDAEDISKMK